MTHDVCLYIITLAEDFHKVKYSHVCPFGLYFAASNSMMLIKLTLSSRFAINNCQIFGYKNKTQTFLLFENIQTRCLSLSFRPVAQKSDTLPPSSDPAVEALIYTTVYTMLHSLINQSFWPVSSFLSYPKKILAESQDESYLWVTCMFKKRIMTLVLML